MSSILIVHPDREAAEALGSILEKDGHRTSTAADGPRALAAYARSRPDIVVVNRVLPSTLSFQVFAEIRRIDPKARILLFELLGTASNRTSRPEFGVRGLRPSEALQLIAELQDGASGKGPETGIPLPRVLIADDDPGVRGIVRKFLTDRGYEAVEAKSGASALSLVKRVRPHLVLLDINMPGMDGLETLRRIREADGAVGVMMMTGNDELETMALCRDQGAYDYLVKPFDFQYMEFSIYSKMLLMTI
jgi:two-component system response regulator (stage 0 sporulation protein F)